MFERLGKLLQTAAFAADALATRAATRLRAGVENKIRAPARLHGAPQDIRTADATVAAEIVAGYFSFEGRLVQTGGASPFDLAAPTPDWRRALAGFSWLRHLPAEGGEAAREAARVLVEDFVTLDRFAPGDPAMEPEVAARRMLSFLAHAPMLLDRADPQFARLFLDALGREAKSLARGLAGRGAGGERLPCAMALLEFALCAGAEGEVKAHANRLFAQELERQILPDGGRVSRNPQAMLDALLDLLPLRKLYAVRGVNPPPALLAAISAMIPMLRLLQHRDGDLALFNGMGVTNPGALATVFAYEQTDAGRLDAPHSGYARLCAGDANVVVDVGSSPPFDYSASAHAGTLSFEFSLGPERVVVNCGAPPARHVEAREAARATAAHSTLTLDDQSSSLIAPPSDKAASGRILAGAKTTPARRRRLRMGEALDAAHDGYAARYGLRHERILALTRDGARLVGQDRLTATRSVVKPDATRQFALRFHLHPSVSARPRLDGFGAELALPSGLRLIFEASAPATLEESVFFAAPGGARATTQIVLTGRADAATRLRWSFSKPSEGAGDAVSSAEGEVGGSGA